MLDTASLPRWSAVMVAVVTFVRLYQDTSWVGDWNQTGSSLGAMGLLGGMIASLLIAIDARRNWRALHSLRHAGTQGRTDVQILIAELWTVLRWPLAGWLFVVVLAYAITAGTTPHPTAPSALPLVTATLFLCLQVLLGHLLGLRVHGAIAAPALVIVCFVLPAAVGSLEPSKIAHFTTSTSYWTLLPSVPSPAFYGAQGAVFASLALLAAVMIKDFSQSWPRALAVGLSALLVIVTTGALLRVEERSHDLARVSRMVCSSGDFTEVCVFTDHVRFLPELLQTAETIASVLPEDARPVRFVEFGLETASEDAILSTMNVPVGPVESVVNSAAEWHVCDPEVAFERFSFLATRAGLDPAEGAFIPDIAAMSEQQQLSWWRNGVMRTC